MGSLDRRIQRLEGVHQPSSGSDNPVERELRRAAFVEAFERAWEKAELEEAMGKPRRRRGLEELIESIRRRRGA